MRKLVVVGCLALSTGACDSSRPSGAVRVTMDGREVSISGAQATVIGDRVQIRLFSVDANCGTPLDASEGVIELDIVGSPGAGASSLHDGTATFGTTVFTRPGGTGVHQESVRAWNGSVWIDPVKEGRVRGALQVAGRGLAVEGSFDAPICSTR